MSSLIKSSQVNFIQRPVEYTEESKDPKDLENKDDISKEELEELKQEHEEMIVSAKEEAQEILKTAKKEAQEIKDNSLENAKEAAEDLKEQAREKGYEEGQSEGYKKGHEEGTDKGYEEGKQESESLIEEANEIKRDYLNEKERVLNSIEEDVIKLVVDITKKILNQKIEEDDEAIIDLVFKGLATLNSKEDIRIRVSKEDFDKVEESKERILSKVSLIENLKVDVDSTLKKGDCIIESAKGNVDVSIDTQMKNVEEELNDLLDSE